MTRVDVEIGAKVSTHSASVNFVSFTTKGADGIGVNTPDGGGGVENKRTHTQRIAQSNSEQMKTFEPPASYSHCYGIINEYGHVYEVWVYNSFQYQ